MPYAPKSRIVSGDCSALRAAFGGCALHMPAGIVAANGKRGRLKAFLCISALDALADYSALAATT